MFLKKNKKESETTAPVPETAPSTEPDKDLSAKPQTAPAPKSLEEEIAEPNEAFFGTILIGCLALSLIAATGYFGFVGYRYYQSIQSEKSIPSIDNLPEKAPEQEEKITASEPASPETPGAEEGTGATVDSKTLVIKVLNGGAAKGVAGTYGEKLKKEGFTKTTVGNTFGDYSGTTLYYAKGQELAVEALKLVVLKDYPALVTKEAESGNKDTTAAPLTLILGR